MKKERRDSKRYDITAKVSFAEDQDTYIMKVNNISRSGTFVSMEDLQQQPWVTVGKKLEIALFATPELNNIQLSGLIVRVSKKSSNDLGFGIAFTYAAPGARDKLHQLVDLAARQSVLPHPEKG